MFKNRVVLLSLASIGAAVFVGALLLTTGKKSSETSTPVEPEEISMIFLPSVDSEVVERNGREIAKDLAELTNLNIKPVFPLSYTTVVEELGKERRKSFAYMGAFGCIAANQKYNSQLALTSVRKGRSWYKSAFFVKRNSPYEKLEDLIGKKWGHPEETSTSGYIFPKYVLESRGIQLSEEVTLGNHPQSLLALMNDRVDFASAYFIPQGDIGYWNEGDDPEKGIWPDKTVDLKDARSSLIEEYPNVLNDIRILEVSQNIPNECIAFSQNLDPETVKEISEAIMRHTRSGEGRALWGDKEFYKIDTFEISKTGFYDTMGEVMKTLDLDLTELE